MGVIGLAKRFVSLPRDDKRYFLRRYVDQQIYRRSGFSQYGEDASVAAYLRTLGRQCRFYLDLGANQPVLHSNSYMYYRDGGNGVLVEANPTLAKRLQRKRPRDIVVNKGLVPEGSGTMNLHIMDMDGLSTLSAQAAEQVASRGMGREQRTVRVETIAINDLLRRHAAAEVDFASIDIEGMDHDVLAAWDFDLCRPFLFCVETAEVNQARLLKDGRLYELLDARGYQPLFETFANTIFVDTRRA